MTSPVSVIVPATTANIGPGFDCLGAALTRYNRFQFQLLSEDTTDTDCRITVIGKEAQKVSTDPNNLLYQSFLKVYQHLRQSPPPISITINLNVPLARGLGSSATAIIGGIVGANQLAGNPLSQAELLDLAIAIEGHPDNVVPALLGNCQLTVGTPKNWQICDIPWHSDLIPVVAIPDFELSTEAARAVLPQTIERGIAIFNTAHLGLLLRGLTTANPDWLREGLQDQLHQPHRQSLITGYHQVKEAAIAAGAYGMVISGAGPTLLALTSTDHAQSIVTAMKTAWQEVGITAEVEALALDTQGTKIR